MMSFQKGQLARITSVLAGMRVYISAWKANKKQDTIDNEMANIRDGSIVLILDSWLDVERDIVFVKFLFKNELFFIEEHYLESIYE